MGNKMHLRHIRQPVEHWNLWRSKNSTIKPDLSGEDLRRAGWRWLVFRKGLGKSAALERADLSGVNLKNANLQGADLTGADLREADLSGADLSGADLTRANLQSADLSEAKIIGATFEGTDLWGAWLEKTLFSNVDLSKTLGLEDCHHAGPSFVDDETLKRSGRLPLSFLRGCGLPDYVIKKYQPLSITQQVSFHSCFISYSSRDKRFAEKLHNDLERKGVRCWFAPKDLKIGAKIRTEIDRSIRKHKKVLLILSKNSIGSDWVEDEVEDALEMERKRKEVILFPIRLDDAVMQCETGWAATIRRTRNIGDFRRSGNMILYKRALGRLLRDLMVKRIKPK